jgi:hypothetical protein
MMHPFRSQPRPADTERAREIERELIEREKAEIERRLAEMERQLRALDVRLSLVERDG